MSKIVYKAQYNRGQYLIKKDSRIVDVVYSFVKAKWAIEDLVEGLIPHFIVDKGYSK